MILEKIILETNEIHKQLETCDLFAVYSTSTVDKDLYKQLLKKLYGFFRPLESRVDSVMEVKYLSDYYERRNSGALLKDIKMLAMPPAEIEYCKVIPRIETCGEAWGAMYVMERITLSASYHAEKIKRDFDISENNGGAFFNAYGNAAEIMWQLFTESLNYYFLSTGVPEEEIISCARETYMDLNWWLNNSNPE